MVKTTLSTIAKKANLSIASVSRVLNTPNLTSPQTQSKVYQAIQELHVDTFNNFKPYQAGPETKKILIIDNQLFSKSLINLGLEQALKKEEYVFFYLRFPYSDNHDIHYLIRYVTQNIFDGIVIINDAPYLEILRYYKNTLPPIILVNHYSIDFTCIYFDHLMIAYQLTQYLVCNSHSKIAVLLNDHDKISSSLFLEGYKQALLRANIIVDPNYIIENCFSFDHGRTVTKRLFKSNKPPSAIICADNISLNYLDENYYNQQNFYSSYSAVLGVLHQANEILSNTDNPLTLTYISHSKDRHYNELDKLSRIYKPLYKMGQKAAILINEIIQKNDPLIKNNYLIEAEPIFY